MKRQTSRQARDKLRTTQEMTTRIAAHTRPRVNPYAKVISVMQEAKGQRETVRRT